MASAAAANNQPTSRMFASSSAMSQVYYSTRQVCVAAYDDDLEWDSSETGLDSSVYEGICRPPYRRKNWRLVRMGLVPEKWKPLQQKLYMTKEERKKEFFDHIAKLAKKKSLAVRAVSGFVVPDAVIHHIFPDNHASSDSETDEEQLTSEEKALLAASKPDFSKATSAKWLPLHTAAASGQAMHVADLLKNGYDINALDKDGLTALHRAIMAGRSAISKQLIDAGADVSVRDSDNATVLHYAVTANCIEVVKILLWECKVDVNASDVDGWTPLHIAVQGQMLKVTGVLINYGADRTLKNKDGNLPLDIALSFGESFGMYEVVTALKATNVVVKRCIKKHPAAKDLYYNSDS